MKTFKILMLFFLTSTAHSADCGTWICSASCYAPGSHEYLPIGMSGNDPVKMLTELNDKCRDFATLGTLFGSNGSPATVWNTCKQI